MDLDDYNSQLEASVADAIEIAERVRKTRNDPMPHVEMELCEDLAERCEKLLQVPGLATKIRELEDEGHEREEISVLLADSFVEGEVGEYETKAEKIDGAIRTAVALLTEGVVAAPIDGIGEIAIEVNDDGTEYIRVPYFGPIRSAGGTGQALSVLVADYIRQKLGIDVFKPREDEVNRYAAELELYDKEVGLQYKPKEKEVKHIVKNCPIMLDGVQTTDAEVEGYRDLERIDGNRGRGGMCLVAGEGIAQKAPKLKKYTEQLQISGWEWLDELSTVTIAKSSDSDSEEESNSTEDTIKEEGESSNRHTTLPTPEELIESLPDASDKYLKDVIAGRPIIAAPSTPGGFRLRYSRARTNGLAACGYSPATMIILDKFIATGTQIKTELPGKAAGASPVDGLEGPTVRLATGELKRIDSVEEAERLENAIEEILDLGEVAIPYGEFLENNYPLVPASYTHEWWVQEFERESGGRVDAKTLNPAQAFALAEKYDIPLHPKYTYLWHDISVEEYESLSKAVDAAISNESHTLPGETREIVESLLIPHTIDSEEDSLHFEDDEWLVLTKCCSATACGETVFERLQDATRIEIRARAPVRLGGRMARPEKADRRTMKPPVHSLFPIGELGGNQRLMDKAASSSTQNEIEDEDSSSFTTMLATRTCPDCGDEQFTARCESCDVPTNKVAYCTNCGRAGAPGESCFNCEDAEYKPYATQELDIYSELNSALETIGEANELASRVKAVKKLTSSSRIPEPLEKGLLRAKHDVDVFRDGTSRYDMVDLPLTEFYPEELGMSVTEAQQLGYTETINGEPLTEATQPVELRIQDIIISESAGDYLVQVATFIDELLVKYYDEEPYYNATTRDDLVGELVVGLAPHTSAGVLGRVIGYTRASVGYAHPFFHAAKRRNCFHPETTVEWVEGDSTIVSKSIKDLFEDQFVEENAQRDDFGAVYSETEGDVYVASVTEAGESVLKEVTHVQRTPAPEALIDIETESGRSITVTPDHDMLVYDGESESLTRKPARFIRSDDVFARPTGEWASELDFGIDTIAGMYGSLTGGYDDGQEQFGTSYLDPVTRVESHNADCEYVYNVTVKDTHTLSIDGLWVAQCDGDEDSVMLLLDGLVNFSKEFLPDVRGKRTMDAPLVMTTIIDPYEIDDEAHNVDIASEYPIEFYEATYRQIGPKDLEGDAKIPIAEDILDNPQGFSSTLTSKTIDAGPLNTAYKTLGGMGEKTEAQLQLAKKTRAIDEDFVAEKVIDKHFYPDIVGNLTAFSRQKFRCPACNEKYRRPPLKNRCETPGCTGSIILTVHEGSVKKYVPISQNLAEEFGLKNYTKQKIDALNTRIELVFEDETSKQSGLADFL